MGDNLTLEALAEIQALEAEPLAQAFRDKWMGSKMIGSEEVDAWLSEAIIAPIGASEFRLLPPGPTSTESIDDDVRAVLPAAVLKKLDGAGWRTWTWTWRNSEGDRKSIKRHSPLGGQFDDLSGLLHEFAQAFGDEWYSAAAFVLAGVTPRLTPVQEETDFDAWFEAVKQLRDGGLGFVSGTRDQRIILKIRSQATLDDVAEAFRASLDRAAQGPDQFRRLRRERQKPMTSERMRDFAVIGGRMALGQFDSWKDAHEGYLAESGTMITFGQFRRDVVAAYTRVTGLELNAEPRRRGRVRLSGEPVRGMPIDGVLRKKEASGDE